jgi:hypothetical protein
MDLMPMADAAVPPLVVPGVGRSHLLTQGDFTFRQLVSQLDDTSSRHPRAARKAAEWVGADALARALADEGVDRQMQ